MDSTDQAIEEQREHMHRMATDVDGAALRASWLREDTVDAWRHRRMYAPLAPAMPWLGTSGWMTVGDGRFGLDAIRLSRDFGIEATATDLSPELLIDAHRKGLLPRWRTENAERLSLPDHAVQVAFAKEALHHCPRPMVALHEMLRVAARACVIIEPADPDGWPRLDWPLRQVAKDIINRTMPGLARRWSPPAPVPPPGSDWEPAGNYVYGFSPRDLIKTARGMGLATVAWIGLGDLYIPGVEEAPAVPGDPLFDQVSAAIAAQESRLRRSPLTARPVLIAGILARTMPPPDVTQAMQRAGWQIASGRRP